MPYPNHLKENMPMICPNNWVVDQVRGKYGSLVKCEMVITKSERNLTSSAPKEAIHSCPPLKISWRKYINPNISIKAHEMNLCCNIDWEIRELGKILPSLG
jgi:hypothetical protein